MKTDHGITLFTDDHIKRPSRNILMLFALVFMCSFMTVYLWFSPLNYHVFVGDDLYWIQTYKTIMLSDRFWSNAFTIGNEAGKFRPVPTALILLATKACGDSYNCFVGFNLFLITANAVLASFVAYKLTSMWLPSVIITSTVIILSRFSYFSALQVLGIMENMAMTFVLLLVLCFYNFIRSAHIKWMAAINLLFMMILFTHERFIVLIVPVFFVIFSQRKELKIKNLLSSLFALILTTLCYFAIRSSVSHARFLTGAGSSSIVDTLNLFQIAAFVSNGALNLLGFNAGPDYLSGKYFMNTGLGGIFVGVLLSGTLAVLFYLFLKQQLKKVKVENNDLDVIVVLVLMIGGMILASSITFRQEYRWLYTPFAVFVLLINYCLGKIDNLLVKSILAVMVVVSFAAVDLFYRQYVGNVYFMYSSIMANSVKRKIVDEYGGNKSAHKEIFLIVTSDVVKNWVLAGGYYFQLYAPEISVHYVKDMIEIPVSTITSNQALAFSVSDTKVDEIPRDVLLKSISMAQYDTVEYDFISNFSLGIWDKEKVASTPNGHVAFLFQWQDMMGLPNNTITLVSPNMILFPSVICKEGSKLIISAGLPYASSDGADLFVDVGIEGKQKRLISVSLNPTATQGVVTWKDYVVSITDCTQEPIAVTFGVSSPSGNDSADWVALKNIKIVADKYRILPGRSQGPKLGR